MNVVDQPTLPFEQYCAERLREEREAVVQAWLEGIAAEPRVRPRPLPQTEALLASVPEVLEAVAEFLCSDEERLFANHAAVTERLTSLAAARFTVGCDPPELVREFELLARVLDGACLEWLNDYPGPPGPKAVVRVAGRLNRAAILMAEIAVGAYRERDGERLRDFVNNLAHELRMPLSAAETAALVLEDDDIITTAQERRRFVGVVQRSLCRARTVIDDVRALALAESAEPEQSARRLPISRVLADVMAQIRESIERTGVRVDVMEPVPDLRVDATRVELILLNLIDNAAKYSDPTLPTRWVRVGFQQDADTASIWWVTVSDNGVGIAAEHRPRIFERFFRAHPERAEGTGLGLAIVREAALQLGSHLYVESEPGVGSTFRFSLRVE